MLWHALTILTVLETSKFFTCSICLDGMWPLWFCRFLGYVLLVRPCIGTTTCPQNSMICIILHINYRHQHWPILTTARRSLFRLWLTVSRWLLPWGPRTHMDPYGPVRFLNFLNFLNFKSKGAAMSCLRPRHLAAAAATLKIVRRDFHDVRQGILRQMSYILKFFVLIELFNEISWKMKCIKSGPGRGWRLIPMSLFRQLRLFGLNIS